MIGPNSVRVAVTLTKEVRDALTAMARAECRTPSEQVAWLLKVPPAEQDDTTD